MQVLPLLKFRLVSERQINEWLWNDEVLTANDDLEAGDLRQWDENVLNGLGCCEFDKECPLVPRGSQLRVHKNLNYSCCFLLVGLHQAREHSRELFRRLALKNEAVVYPRLVLFYSRESHLTYFSRECLND